VLLGQRQVKAKGVNAENDSRRHFFRELRTRVSQYGRGHIFVDERFAPFFASSFFCDPLAFLEDRGLATKSRKPHQTPEVAFRVFELTGLRAGTELLSVIAKLVCPEKLEMPDRLGAPLRDPLFEIKVLGWARALGLPAAEAVGYARWGSTAMIMYLKVRGHTLRGADAPPMLPAAVLEPALEQAVSALRPAYERVGIRRRWRTKDLVFRLDDLGNVTDPVPIDWERASIDWSKLDAALAAVGATP
jgi:hypothetical protein